MSAPTPFCDITEFPALDSDDETWGREVVVLPTFEEALEALHLAEREVAAASECWVDQGIVCDEHQDFRAARGANP